MRIFKRKLFIGIIMVLALALVTDTALAGKEEQARSYALKGHALKKRKQYDKAIEYYQKALRLDLELYGPAHSYVASDYHQLGGCYMRINELDQALENSQMALVIDLIHFGGEKTYNLVVEKLRKKEKVNPDIYGTPKIPMARQYFNVVLDHIQMGSIYSKKKDFEKSLHYHRKAEKTSVTLLGRNHKLTKDIRAEIAAVEKLMKVDGVK